MGELILVPVEWTKNISFGEIDQEVNKRLNAVHMQRVGPFSSTYERKAQDIFLLQPELCYFLHVEEHCI